MTAHSLPPKKRIPSIDMLRGIAALAVCIFHFTNGNQTYFSNNYWLKEVGSIGWAGVEIFFVISGFIIPYSLYHGQYRLKNFDFFLLKRIARIEPPYFFSILIVIALSYISSLLPYFKGEAFHINYFGLMLHVVYLVEFFNQPWLNPVFWTLAVEFQFYLLIGLIFPFINHKKTWVFLMVLTLLFCGSLVIQSQAIIFHYILYFMLGILIFNRKVKIHSGKYIWMLEPLLLIIIYLQFSLAPFVAATFAWLILSYFENWENKLILWLGAISYSLYLIHVPIGGRMINFSANFFNTEVSRSFALLGALVATCIFAYLFHQLIEKPAIRLSHAIIKKKTS
ncbi:MAG: acyltransferase [Bacteroidota bacterium]